MNNFTGTQGTSLHTATTTVLNAKGNTAFSNWAYRLLFLCLAFALTTGVVKAQLMANYAFSSNTNASLEDISVNPDWEDLGNADSKSSGVQPIGFTMYFMGGAYTHFSFNSNGQMRLHPDASATQISTGAVSSVSANVITLAAFSGDNEIQTALRYKVLGTAPNRKLVVEFTGFYVYWTPNLENAGNMQIWLNEGSNQIDYVYGEIYNASSSSQTRSIFLASSNTTTTVGSVTIAATPTFTTGTATLTTNSIAGGSGTTTGSPLIEHIGSSSQGNRRIMSFLPTPPTGTPSGLNFTSVQALQLTVNWTDNSTEEIGYIVQYSSDGGNNWTTATVTAADATSTTVTGLSASTNYDWRVAAIREVPGTFATATQATTAPGIATSIQSGNWSDVNTWSSGQVPSSSDDVTISDGHTVTQDVTTAEAYSLTVGSGAGSPAFLQFDNTTTARSLSVGYDVVINSNGNLISSFSNPASLTTHTLQTSGNMYVNGSGVFNSNTFPNSRLALSFTGSNDATFTTSAAATININALTLNKGAGATNTLDFNTGGAVTLPATGFLTITNGIFKISGTGTWANPVFVAGTPTISASMGIWLDNPNVIVTAKNASSSISGYFRITQGTYNIGTLASALIGGATTTNMIIEGGTLNVSGRLYVTSAGSFNMSGGVINVQTAGNNTTSSSGSFGFSSTTASFTMSGGVINIVHPSTGTTPYDTYINVTTPNITGGLINIGVPGITPPSTVFNGVRQRVPSIHIGDGFTANTLATGLTVLGNLSVGTGATYNFNNSASTNFSLIINGNSSAPGNIINNGLITHNLANTQAIRMQMFGQHGVQTVSGSGSIGIPTGPIFGMGISNPAGVNFTSANALYTNRINLFEGDVTGANNITLGNSTSTVIQISQDNSTVMGGSLDAAPTFNSSGHTILYLDEPNPRTSGFEIPSSRVVSSISITNDNSDLTLAGGNVTTTSLGLNAGNITTDGSNVLIVTGAITGGSADSYVNGPLVRGLAANLTGTTTVNFPIGKSGYNPLDLVNPVTGAGTVGVLAEVFDANSGGTPGNLLNQLNTARYWNVDIVDGAANFTGTHIRLNDTRGIFDQIASSATVNGTYELVGGLDPVLDPESITSSNPAISALAGYYLMAQAEASDISNIVANPAGSVCDHVQRTITATVTPGAGTVTGVVINYSVNSVPQTPITMTNTGGNNWEGIIPTVTPANATVVWSITATESTNLTATTADETYQDEPLTNVGFTVQANPTTLCAGENTTLLAIMPSEIEFSSNPATAQCCGGNPYRAGGSANWENKVQILYLASELTAAGAQPGPILSLALNTTVAAGQLLNFTIYMGHTSATSMTTTFLTDPLTQVFQQTPFFTATPNSWNTHEFDTPFMWDGVSNIVIEFRQTTPSTTSTTTTNQQSPGFTCITYSGSLTGYAATTGTTITTRPIMRFGFNGFDAYDLEWSDGTNTIGTTPEVVTAVPATTNYSFTITDENGCTKSEEVLVTANPLPAAPGSAVGSSQCGEGVPEAFATGGLPGTYLWYLEPTGGTALPGENNQALQNYSISTTTTFYVALTDGNCISTRVPVTATVIQPDAIDAVFADNEICLGEQADLSINQTGSNQTYTYTWTATPETGSGITNGTQGAPLSFTPTAAGTYEYSVVAVDGPCTTSASTTLTVVALPPVTTATATPASICFGESSTLAATSVPSSAQDVTFGAGAATSNSSGSPFYALYGGGKISYIYTAAELQAQGLVPGPINSMSIEVTVAGIVTYKNFTIGIGHTAETQFTTAAHVTDPVTNVFTGPLTDDAYLPSLGINTFNFSSPFIWDGTSNIVVTYCWSNEDGGASTANGFTVTRDTYTGQYLTAYTYADNRTAAQVCATVSGGVSDGNTTTGGTSRLTSRTQTTFNATVGVDVTDDMTWEWNPGALTGASTVVSPASTEDYTVTVTDPNTGCSNSFGPVTVTVNQLPEAPIGTDSEHCGLLVPDAFVSTGGANGSGVFNWYDAPTGGNLLQTGTDASYLTAIDVSTTFYVSEIGANGCESERTPVNVTVIEADAISLSATALTPCIGSDVTLEVTQTGGNNTYTFTYSADPLTGSGITGSESGSLVVVVPTAAGTYTYSVTGDDTDKGCLAGATAEFTIHVDPVITQTSASPTTICSGETVTLTGFSSIGASGQDTVGIPTATLGGVNGNPYRSGNGVGNQLRTQLLYTAAEMQAAGFSTGNITGLGFITTSVGGTLSNMTIKIGTTSVSSLNTTFETSPMTEVFSTPSFTPVANVVNFHAFSTPFFWDGASNILVEVCQTNSISGTTTVRAYTPGFVSNVQAHTSTTSCSNLTGSEVANKPIILFEGILGTNITDTYTWEWNPGALAGDTITVSPGATETYTATVTDINGCISISDPVDVTVLPLPPTPTATPSTQCGIGVPTASVTDNGGTLLWYDAATGGNLLQTGGNTYTTAIDVTTTFYVSETDGTCESERVAVTVTVTQPDPVTASVSDISICPAESITLEATQTGSNQSYVYTWNAMPETGSGLVNGTQGASLNITPTAAGSYEYTVTAFDAGQSCTVISSTTLVVNPQPVITSLTSTPPTICSGGNADLVAESIVSTEGTATIGSQTTTSITGSPYRGGTANSKVQYLFLASELAAQGIQPGNIVSVGFNVTSGTTFTPIPDFEISMVQTNLSALTSTFVTGLTTVYGPQTYVPQLGVNTHTLSAPFVWDGVSNIVIQVCNSTISPLGTSLNVSLENVGSGKMYYSTSTTGCATVTGTSSVNRPVMEFGGTVGTDVTSLYNYVWTPGNLTGSTVSVNPTVTTTYSVVATNPFSQCSSEIEEVTVTVAPVGSAASASATTSCAGSPVVLDANPTGGAPFTFSWSDGTNVVGTTEELTVSPTATTTYTVTVTDACNNSTNSQVTVTVNDLPVVSINETSPVSVCDPATPTLTATSSVPNVTYEWYQDGNPIPASDASSYVASQSASYTVQVTDNNTGCIGLMSAPVVVEINAIPSALQITPSPASICSGTTVELTATGGTIGGTGTGVITGTSPGTTTSFMSPFYRTYEGSRRQYLLRATELQAMGMGAGSSLNSVSFNVTALSRADNLNHDNYVIKIGNTASTSLSSAYAPEALTQVYYSPSYIPVVGANVFTFSSPHVWDGTSNVVLEICFDNDPDGTCTSGTPVCWSNAATVSSATSLTGSVRYNYQDNTVGTPRDFCSSTAGTNSSSTIRPIMTFEFSTVETTNITWSPQSGLFTDAAGTIPYAGEPASSVYAMPSADETYTALATSVAGCSGDPVEVDVTVTPALTVSADIAGPTNATAHVGSLPVATYSIATTNETSITWDIPAGSTNVTGQGTNTISFNYPIGYGGGSISVTVEGNAPCDPITRTLTITYDCPVAPVVSGPTNVCPFVGTSTEVTYTVAPDPGVSSYNWVVPPNVAIVSGQGTGSLTVTFQTGFTTQANKQIRVTGQSGCGNTAMTIYYLLTQFPSAAGPITGPSDACAFIGTSNEATYSIDPVTAAESYLWTVPSGVTIVSGAGTSSINVTFDNSFTTSAITVRAVNGCGTSTPRSITVTRTAPSTPSLISGPTNACMLMPTSANPSGVPAVYTVTNVPGNTYTWVVPSGATINSGQGTNSIEVSFDGTYSGGNINVFASTSCGNSGIRSLSLTQLTPSAPAAIDVLELGACPDRMVQYSLASVPSNTTNLLWTIPAGATLMSGQGTNTIVVSYPGTALAGNVTVTAQNGCGNSSTRVLKVKLSACEVPPPPPLSIKDGGVKEVPSLTLEVNVFPNPSTHVFNLQAKSADVKTRVVVKVMDNLGRVMESHNMMPGETQQVGTRLKAGTYFIEVMQGNQRVTKRVIKF